MRVISTNCLEAASAGGSQNYVIISYLKSTCVEIARTCIFTCAHMCVWLFGLSSSSVCEVVCVSIPVCMSKHIYVSTIYVSPKIKPPTCPSTNYGHNCYNIPCSIFKPQKVMNQDPICNADRFWKPRAHWKETNMSGCTLYGPICLKHTE